MSTASASSSTMAAIDRLMKLAADNGATEVRLSGGVAPMLRIDDQVRPLKTKPLTGDEVAAMASAVMPAGADPAAFQFQFLFAHARTALSIPDQWSFRRLRRGLNPPCGNQARLRGGHGRKAEVRAT